MATLGNDAIKLQATVLYADLADSTRLVDEHVASYAAEMYKTFLHCAAKIIRTEDGTITAYDGDRIMAVYLGDQKNSCAIRSALKIHDAVTSIINPARQAMYHTVPYTLKSVVGIDTSALYIAKTSVRGANDLVWVGRAANYAAKLAFAGIPTRDTCLVHHAGSLQPGARKREDRNRRAPHVESRPLEYVRQPHYLPVPLALDDSLRTVNGTFGNFEPLGAELLAHRNGQILKGCCLGPGCSPVFGVEPCWSGRRGSNPRRPAWGKKHHIINRGFPRAPGFPNSTPIPDLAPKRSRMELQRNFEVYGSLGTALPATPGIVDILPIMDLYGRLEELQGMTRLLIDDVLLLKPAIGDGDPHPSDEMKAYRRCYVRAVFALVEAFVEQHRRLLVELADGGIVTVPEGKLLELREIKDVLDASGAVIGQREKYLQVFDKIKAVYKAAGDAFGQQLNITFGDDGWTTFREAMELRNQVTHPKTVDDCWLFEGHLQTVHAASEWFKSLQNEFVRVARAHREQHRW